MDAPDLQDQQRATVAAILDQHGSTAMGTLRRIYGADFAPGFGAESLLARIVLLLDEPSLKLLVDDFDKGLLTEKIDAA
jgi:hypothetical protein